MDREKPPPPFSRIHVLVMITTIKQLARIFVFCLLALLPLSLYLNFYHATTSGSLTSCKSGLKNIATALEMYSSDNKGLYPDSLSTITPGYLKALPFCGFTREHCPVPLPYSELYIELIKPGETYSRGYEVHHSPENYTIRCMGVHHSGDLCSRPTYSSLHGLLE